MRNFVIALLCYFCAALLVVSQAQTVKDGVVTMTTEQADAINGELNRRAESIRSSNHVIDNLIHENEVLRAKSGCA